MYTPTSILKRASAIGMAAVVMAAAILPATSAFADTLNPLTERSLLLSSSAPGFQNSDGSGNTAANPNAINQYYAPPGSGPNGQKSGETFTFRVSSDSSARAIKAFTLQYCFEAAGLCKSPGNNTGDAKGAGTRNGDTATTSDLNVNYTGAVYGTDYEIYVNNVLASGTDWALTTSNEEDEAHSQALTGRQNFITLANTGAGLTPSAKDQVKIVFKASPTHYITNPGSGSFFVKINTYDSELTANHIPAMPAATNTHIIDGGVTVANVMTDSIHITTKVLETMSFSVGTRNRDTVAVDCAITQGVDNGCAGVGATHGTCDAIQQVKNNQLQLGNPDAEYSLETGKAWDVNSYWRLSSNSSGGATVYYSGNTLANTVGDQIAPVGAAASTSNPGTEQFGLGFVDANADAVDAPLTVLRAAQPTRYKISSLTSDLLAPAAAYANATGGIQKDDPSPARFAFEQQSNTVPRVIATNNLNVISCATAKMRYVANIGADTPAGVYTTKINYLAAPQY